jgi:nucleotide-binding universal stress UspA family protein
MRLRKILVPHDFSPQADKALTVAADLAGTTGQLLVLHTIVPFVPVTDLPPGGLASYVSPEELLDGARRQLTGLVKKVTAKRPGLTVKTRVEIGDPYQRIIAATRGMDVIVMATSGRTGLAHLLIGSVAEKIVRHSPIPVLTLRPGALRRSTRKSGR